MGPTKNMADLFFFDADVAFLCYLHAQMGAYRFGVVGVNIYFEDAWLQLNVKVNSSEKAVPH